MFVNVIYNFNTLLRIVCGVRVDVLDSAVQSERRDRCLVKCATAIFQRRARLCSRASRSRLFYARRRLAAHLNTCAARKKQPF